MREVAATDKIDNASLVYIGDVRNPSLLMLWTCEEVLGETTCMCVYSCSHVQ